MKKRTEYKIFQLTFYNENYRSLPGDVDSNQYFVPKWADYVHWGHISPEIN